MKWKLQPGQYHLGNHQQLVVKVHQRQGSNNQPHLRGVIHMGGNNKARLRGRIHMGSNNKAHLRGRIHMGSNNKAQFRVGPQVPLLVIEVINIVENTEDVHSNAIQTVYVGRGVRTPTVILHLLGNKLLLQPKSHV